MIFKKNWFTNLIWIVASVIIGLNIVNYTKLVIDMIPFIRSISEKRGYIYVGGAVLCILLLIGLFFGIRAIVKACSEKIPPIFDENEQLKETLMRLLFFLIAGGAAAVRVILMMANKSPVLDDPYYFEQAMIKINSSVPDLEHNASHLYIIILSFVMKFLGNKVISAVILQFVLQMVSLGFMYFGLCMVAGFYPAVVCTAVFAFNPSYMHLMYVADAQCLVILLFSAAFYFLGRIFQIFYKELSSIDLVMSIVFAGLFCGWCCHSEPYGLVLFVFALMYCFRDSDWLGQGAKNFLAFGVFISAAGVLAFLFTFDSMKNNVDIINPIRLWIKYLRDVDPVQFRFFDPAFAADTTWIGFALSCCAFLIFPGYLTRNRTRFIAFAFFLAMAPIPFSVMGYLRYEALAPWVWAVLAGYGLQLMLTQDDANMQGSVEPEPEPEPEERPVPVPVHRAKQVTRIKRELPEAVRPAEEIEETLLVEETEEAELEETEETEPFEEIEETEEVGPEEEVEEALPVEEAEAIEETEETEEAETIEEIEETEEAEEIEEAEPEEEAEEALPAEEADAVWSEEIEETEPFEEIKETEETEAFAETEPFEELEAAWTEEEAEEPAPEPEPVKKPTLIPNPLPLPKKHVRKQADYALTWDDEDDFDFDVDVSDDDDFDI